MSLPPLPPGAKLDVLPPLPPGATLDGPEPTSGVPGSPLEKALASQTGDVVTVETPTGPAKFTRGGARFYDDAEAGQQMDEGGARMKERGLEGALSFLSGGGPMVDEMAGVKGAVTGRLPLFDGYRAARDTARNDVSRSTRNASPMIPVGSYRIPALPLAGAVLPSLMAPNPSSVLARIGASGAQGAESALGNSEADLTMGEFGRSARDVGAGTGTGLLAGGVAEGIAVPMRAIARGAASRIGDSVATQTAKDAADVAGEVSTIRGQLGGESQKASRMFENTQRAASGGIAPAGASSINPALQGRALLSLSDPATVRLQEKVLERSLGEIPGQTAKVTALEQQLATKTAGAAQEASQRTSDYFSKPAFETEIAPRLGRLAYNSATGALTGGAAGAAMGMGSLLTGVGDPLTAAGVGLATGITQGLGKSAITMSRNAMAQPRLQVGALQSLIGAAQAGQRALRSGARATASVAPTAGSTISKDEEESIQAFLGSP